MDNPRTLEQRHIDYCLALAANYLPAGYQIIPADAFEQLRQILDSGMTEQSRLIHLDDALKRITGDTPTTTEKEEDNA